MKLDTIVAVSTIVVMLSTLTYAAYKSGKENAEKIAQYDAITDNEFYSPFEDIIYVKSTDTGWEVGTEEYGILFVEMKYNEAISMASVLTWIGYQCDYTCKEEMVEKARFEHYQLLYHE